MTGTKFTTKWRPEDQTVLSGIKSNLFRTMGVKVEVLYEVKRQKLQYFGFVLRNQKYRLLHLIMERKIEGQRGPGRRKTPWLRAAVSKVQTKGLEVNCGLGKETNRFLRGIFTYIFTSLLAMCHFNQQV